MISGLLINFLNINYKNHNQLHQLNALKITSEAPKHIPVRLGKES